jgi:hypothetical protein
MRNRKIRAERRTEQIPIRFSAGERDAVLRVAKQEHDYPSSYLRKLCLKYIEQREVTNAKRSQPAETI